MTTEPPSDKLFTAEETAILRRKYVEKKLIPALQKLFDAFTELRSAALFVAQYWDDEAHDAVYPLWVFSVLETPDFDYPFSDETLEESDLNSTGGEDDDYPIYSKIDQMESDPVNLPGLGSHHDLGQLWGLDPSHGFYEWISLNPNELAIPLFAAFCKEGADQGLSSRENYSLFALFRRKLSGIEVEYRGEMLRPWLEGIYPEWFQQFPDSIIEQAQELRDNLLTE